MELGGVLADPQASSDRLVRQSLREELKDFDLARREGSSADPLDEGLGRRAVSASDGSRTRRPWAAADIAAARRSAVASRNRAPRAPAASASTACDSFATRMTTGGASSPSSGSVPTPSPGSTPRSQRTTSGACAAASAARSSAGAPCATIARPAWLTRSAASPARASGSSPTRRTRTDPVTAAEAPPSRGSWPGPCGEAPRTEKRSRRRRRLHARR